MKTKHIDSTLRNATTPAARLAAWQSRPPAYCLRQLRETLAKPYNSGETLASARKAAIAGQGPELSAPDAEKPLLWLSGESDPEILDAFAGRTCLDHRGWFSDDFQDETLETYAVRLRRFPHLMFYAVKNSWNGDLRVELSNWEEIPFFEAGSDYEAQDAIAQAAREVIRGNDSSTENEAEESREYYRKDQVEWDIEENRETLTTLRGEIRTLAHELKALCPSPLAVDYPAAGKALRDALKALLRERRELMAENLELAASV